MKFKDIEIKCSDRTDRFELFFFADCHFGKYNCYESALRAEVREIQRREKMPHRIIRAVGVGDINDVVIPADNRFDFNEVADWLLKGKPENIKEKLNDIAKAQIDRSSELFAPIRHLFLGNIEANHDRTVRKHFNHDVHKDFCRNLGIEELTDEAILRFRFYRATTASSTVQVYLRHGYGSSRTFGGEANKIRAMMGSPIAHNCDVCVTAHTHVYCGPIIVPRLYIPNRGRLPDELLQEYRFGVNPGSWLLSHKRGPGSYESAACYEGKAIMTTKMVVWPFYELRKRTIPKIEIRSYPIL